jgi:hypothetical protein
LELNVVPLRVHFGAHSYLDKVSLSQEQFYAELGQRREHPQTSQPPPGDFRRMYEFLLSHYEAVVSISVTAKVSGTYNAARTAASRLPGSRVDVLDSANVSLGQGLIAIHAAESALAGLSGVEVRQAAEWVVSRTQTFGMLRRLDFAVSGGRVPPIIKTLSEWLRFAPVLASFPDGRIAMRGVLFGRSDLTRHFARFVRRRIEPGKRYRVAVGHANDEREGKRLLELIATGLPNVETLYLTAVGTALGVHGGQGMLVAAIQERALSDL